MDSARYISVLTQNRICYSRKKLLLCYFVFSLLCPRTVLIWCRFCINSQRSKSEFKYAVLIIPEHSPYGPSPLGRPSPEMRAFLSPPTLLEGPLRLSPLLPGGGGRGILFKHLYYSRFLPYFIFSSQLIFKMIFKVNLWKIQAFLALTLG